MALTPLILMATEGLLQISLFSAGSFTVGVEYEIVTEGSTDFTLIGASNSNPGTVFVATGKGLGDGTAELTAPPDPVLEVVPLELASYTNQVIVADYTATIAAYISAEANGYIPQSLVDDFIHRLDNSAPYIANTVPASDNTTESDYSTIIAQHVINLFPSVQQYVQYVLIAMGQVQQANQYINSAVNGVCEETFTTQDALMTGNIAALSTDVQALGQELIDTGELLSFIKLDNLGTPQAIIESLMRITMLGTISDELTLHGIDVVTLVKVINDNPDKILSPIVQKRCYDTFKVITGEKLASILDIMKFTPDGIATLADLLDLTKIFPNIFNTLTMPFNGQLVNIYTNGEISSETNSLPLPIGSVLPDDITKANLAFVISLGQLNGIISSSPTRLGTAALAIEDNTGLANTSNLQEALPASTSAGIVESMGVGSGPNGTFYLSDLVGQAAGIPYNSDIAIMNTNFEFIQADGGFVDIAEVLLVMRDVLIGPGGPYYTDTSIPPAPPNPITYTIIIPNPLPGEGTYTSYSSAIAALLIALDTVVAEYIAIYPARHQEMLTAFNSSFDGTVAGIKQLWEANIRFETTYVGGYETNDPDRNGAPINKKTTLAFAENLHNYGVQTDKGGVVEILEAMAVDNLGGNAIVAAMREGRNIAKLNAAGIKGDNQISPLPTAVEPGNIS